MSVCFTRFHPNLIVGGTYSGQIVLWDTRSNKRTPVQRSPLSAAAHTHPIYCVQVVGTQNSHNLITISTDGRLCSWSLDMLSAAQDILELNQSKQSRPVAVTSMSFPVGEANNFVLGSEEGAVYSACRHGTKAGIIDCWEGHQAPVSSVDFHPQAHQQVAFSHLFLSSSLDWTVKLWSTKEKSARPLHSFEHNFDYVYDARWSPVHPAVFATADGTGKLDLWNLNVDTELPTASAQVEGAPALNRLTWTPNGSQIAVGDDQGKIHLFDVGEVSWVFFRLIGQSFLFLTPIILFCLAIHHPSKRWIQPAYSHLARVEEQRRKGSRNRSRTGFFQHVHHDAFLNAVVTSLISMCIRSFFCRPNAIL